MAGFSNPYLPGSPGAGPAGSLDGRKRALLNHITGHGASAVNSGGRVMNPGNPFGSLPHFAPQIGSVMGLHSGEQFGNLDPISVQQAGTGPVNPGPVMGQGGSAPMGGGSDTGGTQMIFPSGGPPQNPGGVLTPPWANQFYGQGLNSGVGGLASLLSGYGGAGGGFWRGY